MSFEIPKAFSQAAGRILVTVGAKEKGIMKRSATALVSANPNCTGVILPHVGHGMSLAMPDYFNRMVEAWIDNGALPDDCIAIT